MPVVGLVGSVGVEAVRCHEELVIWGVRRGGFASPYLSSKLWAGLFSYFSATLTMRCLSGQGREGGSVIDTGLQIR